MTSKAKTLLKVGLPIVIVIQLISITFLLGKMSKDKAFSCKAVGNYFVCKQFKIKYIEEFRIKKYEVGGVDRFDEHVDVIDHKSAKRCLAMLFYLNGVDEGGKTIFPYHHKEFTPVKGSVIIFPPTWEYPHLGEPPISNPKYIMSSYLHYH